MPTNAPLAPPPAAQWPWQRSLQTRILLTYGTIFVVILALLMLVIGRVVYQAQLAGAERTLEVEAFLAANALQDPFSGYAAEFDAYARWEHDRSISTPAHSDDHDGAPPAGIITSTTTSAQVAGRLQDVAARFAADTDARVTILDPRGGPVADSAAALAVAPNQLAQREVQAALRGQVQQDVRADPLTGESTLYVAAPIRQGDRVLGLVQLGRPMRAVTASAQTLLLNLAALGLLALLMATALAVGVARRLVQPVQALERAALAIAGGDLNQRVPVTTADELGALARAFNTMVTGLRELLEQQRLFVANASHELRTPLTNIKLRSEALLDAPGRDPAAARRYLVEIDREADRLGRLAGALLDLSSLTEEGRPPPPGPADIAPVLRTVAEAMQLRATQARLTLTVEVPEVLPLIRAWPEQVEAIAVNLLDNAIKYTPAPGTVRLSACASEGRCLICVADTGPGIAGEDIPHIFERFYRADKARSRGVYGLGIGSGAGLGLSIVQALVEQNGGRIRVESAAGHGTVFEVEFPAAVSG